MSILVKSTVRSALLACFVLLGMQLCFPVLSHATVALMTAEEAALPPLEPEDGSGCSELDQTLAIIATHGAFVAFEAQRATPVVEGPLDKDGLTLLPVAGRQPSAP